MTELTESEVRQELKELQQTFDLHWDAEQRGIKMWQEATGRELTWPDTADFTAWLIDRLERAEKVIEVARQLGKVELKKVPEVSDLEACAFQVVLHVVVYDKENGQEATEETE